MPVKAEHRQAIAKSLAEKRKRKMDNEEEGTATEAGAAVYPKKADDTGLSEETLMAEKLAEGMQAEQYAANGHDVQDAQHEKEMSAPSDAEMGLGELEDKPQQSPPARQPAEHAPKGISKEAMEILAEKKRTRKYNT